MHQLHVKSPLNHRKSKGFDMNAMSVRESTNLPQTQSICPENFVRKTFSLRGMLRLND